MKQVQFEEVLKEPIRNGLTKPKAIRGSGVKMISMGEIFAHNRISKIAMDRVPVTDKEFSNCSIKAGDLLFARQSLVLDGAGKCSIVTEVTEDTVFESHLIRARIDGKKANPYFLYYYFNSHEGRENIKTIVEQVAAAGIRGSDLIKLWIPCPDIDIQNQVASILDAVDRKIELNRKVNDNLEQQAAALFKSWFVDFSLFGGTVPENWEDTTLENITTLITRGIAPKYSDNSDQTVVNQKCIRNHTIDLSLARTHTPKAINEKWLKFGDLLINSTGDGTLGRVAQVWFAPKALTVDSHVTIVRPAREELIFYIGLWGILHEKEIESLHTGSTGQTELPRDRVKMLKLLLPDNISLSRFNSIIAPMASTIILNQEENQKLASLRDTLLPKLMSGEIDVSSIQL
mgnify:CR=1 FL=1